MLSYQVESPISLVVSGIAVVIVGIIGTLKGNKKQNNRKWGYYGSKENFKC